MLNVPPYTLWTAWVLVGVALYVCFATHTPASISAPLMLLSVVTLIHHSRRDAWVIEDGIKDLDLLCIAICVSQMCRVMKLDRRWWAQLWMCALLIAIPPYVLGTDGSVIHTVAAMHAFAHLIFVFAITNKSGLVVRASSTKIV